MPIDWDTYAADFAAEATRLGKDPQFVASFLAYAKQLADRDLPIIADFPHLSALLGVDPAALANALDTPRSLYKTSFIPKRTGGYRRIDSPIETLKQCQVWILRNILDKVTPHDSATAFFAGRSIKDNARRHLAQPMILSLDVRNFFPSLGLELVQHVFDALGYAEAVSTGLVRLTTYRGGLPQGAPTSPSLSNLIMRSFDEELAAWAEAFEVSYSRYADDITISGVFHPGAMIELCRQVLAKKGLALNESKTRLMQPHQRQEVTGVVVNKRVQAPRNLRRYLRQQVYQLERWGIPRKHVGDAVALAKHVNHLRGIAEFILFINEDDREAMEATRTLGGRIRFPLIY